ncbi:MAG: cupin domain-containing protein [Kiloniellaceae bacterium]
MADSLNADFTKRAVVETAKMDWQASPSPTVWRKRLDLVDGEHSRVTSIVRYHARSSFPPHDHPEGEEILVLKGTFSDEHGDYPAATYLLNPPGFRHAPYSRRGCVLFVKLCQYGGDKRGHVVVDTKSATWTPGPVPGVDVLPLYQHPAHPETMALMHFSAGAALPGHDCRGGEEIFVLDGELLDGDGRYPKGTWLRLPHGSAFAPRSNKGCTLYVKRGHLLPPA